MAGNDDERIYHLSRVVLKFLDCDGDVLAAVQLATLIAVASHVQSYDPPKQHLGRLPPGV